MIRFSSGASRELEADYRRYERQRPGRGKRFLAAIDVVLARLLEAADSFPLLRSPDVRSAKVERFPYRIDYKRTQTEPSRRQVEVAEIRKVFATRRRRR